MTLPHTWNGIDGQDGGNDYHRGTGYYAKSIPASLLSAPVNYIQFEGVNSSAEVYRNGEKLNSTILDMAKGFTVKRILSMVSLMCQETPSKEEMLAINKKLNKIKKK